MMSSGGGRDTIGVFEPDGLSGKQRLALVNPKMPAQTLHESAEK